MNDPQKLDLTAALVEIDATGDGARLSPDELMPIVYDELRRLAARYLASERPGPTLEATALVNEAYLRLVDQTRVQWRGRTHFFAVAAQAMRRILVDHARSRLRDKRGGRMDRVTLNEEVLPAVGRDAAFEDILALDEALTKLAELDPREASLVEHRFFAGLTVEESAAALGISTRTAEGDWMHARAWLQRALTEGRRG